MWRASNLHQLILGLTVFCFLVISTRAQDAGNNTAASVFISPTRDLAFALNVPSDSTTDLYFTLMMPAGITWGAVGLGSAKMAGSLILLAYPSSSGQNVTLSPRIAHGHSEPAPAPEIEVAALEGTGLANESYYVFRGRCANCRAWSNGKIDVASKAQNMLFATGESGELRSDAPDAPLKMHYNYGTFTMDMVHATGPGAVPAIRAANDSAPVATVQGLSKEGKKDVAAVVHAIVMVFVFVAVYPFGILILRLGNWVRWHGINQGLALVGIIIGSALGFHISGFYNRSKKFNTAHQVIGILIFIFIFVQFTLGFLHHRTFKKTQQTTKLAPIHVWMGRVIMIMGVVNGFLGFPLAQSPHYNYVLAGLVLFVFPGMAIIFFTKRCIQKRWKKSKEASDEPNGYRMEPWRQPNVRPGYGPTITITAPSQKSPTIQSGRVPAMGSYAPYQSSQGGRGADLGPQQNVKEYV
ncbi:putative iron reductase domain protein [Xylariaceae sp. FL0662B]|nr:putative iron reductase domain protein [Xylariaceae sp. FL0662B]